MNAMRDLATSLLDLLHELAGTGVNLIVGGGFGIYLKVDFVRNTKPRTLLREWPEPRSTNDLDLFLRAELLIESERLRPLSRAIGRLGYQVVPSAAKYQFVKPGPNDELAGSVKIDLLTGPRSCFIGTSVKTDERRAQPNPSVDIHAHPTDEAVTLEQGLLSIPLGGQLSSGGTFQGEVFLPHPYTFLMMKLFAFKDRFGDPSKGYARHHALDLYTILATTTENEWRACERLRDENSGHPRVVEAGKVVADYFSGPDSLGMIRLRESPYYRPELQTEEFISALAELFPAIS